MAIIGALAHGKTETILNEASSGAGSQTVEFTVESDSILISLFADVVSGSLTVSVYTMTDSGKEVGVINFPVLSAPTSELLLKKAAAVMSRVRVVATYTGATVFEVRARGINAGETSVKILGASGGNVGPVSITATASLVFPISLTDRNGLIIKHNSPSGILYLGFSLAQATAVDGYPLYPYESLGIDLGGGATLYAMASTGTIDVRTMESAF